MKNSAIQAAFSANESKIHTLSVPANANIPPIPTLLAQYHLVLLEIICRGLRVSAWMCPAHCSSRLQLILRERVTAQEKIASFCGSGCGRCTRKAAIHGLALGSVCPPGAGEITYQGYEHLHPTLQEQYPPSKSVSSPQ